MMSPLGAMAINWNYWWALSPAYAVQTAYEKGTPGFVSPHAYNARFRHVGIKTYN